MDIELELTQEQESARQARADAEKPIEWETPRPLPSIETLFPVPDFDYDLLPEAVRAWVADISERMQCPPEFVAVGALVSLSGVIGRKVLLKPKRNDTWKVTPNLWGACIGRPGVMKSPALAEAMLPLRRLEAEANEDYQNSVRDYEARKELNGMVAKSRKTEAEGMVKKKRLEEAEMLLRSLHDYEDEPTRRRFIITDATVEALTEILMENPWGLLAYRDELSGLLRSLDREGQESARSFYLQAYDGNQSWVCDRVGRGRGHFIEAVCLSMLGSIQPGKLGPYVRSAIHGGDGDDGLLQRLGLMVYPVINSGWRNVDRHPDKDAKDRAYAVYERLASLDPGTEAIEMRFSEDAQGIFEEWRHDIEGRLRKGDMHPALESHLSKYRKLVPALALVCALADEEAEVSEASLVRALAWSELLEAHALKVYGMGGSGVEGARALLQKIREGKVAEGFTIREIQQKGWAYLGSRDEVKEAINCLEEFGYLKEVIEQTEGRPRTFCRINPEVMSSRGSE